MRIEITESASDDISESHLFYEMQEPGLGYYFETSMMSEIRSLVVYAGIHEIHFERYHRKITRHFPHAIYYRVENDVIQVYAVLDTRRNPALISDRLN
jgi:plasmid stabilization system protein ParE